VRVEIVAPASCKSAGSCVIRALLVNDSYEPVTVSRNAFVGPNLRAVGATGQPLPDSVEATFGGAEEPLTLQPFTLYGRERTFSGLGAGRIEVMAHYSVAADPPGVHASAWLEVEP
jgi:hypothetical protein